MRLKSSAVGLGEGETAILTLADADILAADGTIAEDTDVLEESSKARDADLARKRRYAPPSLPSSPVLKLCCHLFSCAVLQSFTIW